MRTKRLEATATFTAQDIVLYSTWYSKFADLPTLMCTEKEAKEILRTYRGVMVDAMISAGSNVLHEIFSERRKAKLDIPAKK